MLFRSWLLPPFSLPTPPHLPLLAAITTRLGTSHTHTAEATLQLARAPGLCEGPPPSHRPAVRRQGSFALPTRRGPSSLGGGNAPAFMPTGRGWTRWVLSSCPQGAQASEGDRWGQRALARCDKCTHAAWVMRRGESAPQKTPAPTALTLTPGRASPPGPVPGELCTDLGHRGSW